MPSHGSVLQDLASHPALGCAVCPLCPQTPFQAPSTSSFCPHCPEHPPASSLSAGRGRQSVLLKESSPQDTAALQLQGSTLQEGTWIFHCWHTPSSSRGSAPGSPAAPCCGVRAKVFILILPCSSTQGASSVHKGLQGSAWPPLPQQGSASPGQALLSPPWKQCGASAPRANPLPASSHFLRPLCHSVQPTGG